MVTIIKKRIMFICILFTIASAQQPDVHNIHDMKKLEPSSVPVSIVFTAVEGGSNPFPKVFEVDYSFRKIKVEDDQRWIKTRVTKNRRLKKIKLTIVADISGLEPGKHKGKVTVTGRKRPGAKTRMAVLNVTLNLQASAASFTDIDAGLTDVAYGSVAWGDYDADGDLDLALCGAFEFLPDAEMVPFSEIYQNDDGVFTSIDAGLVDVWWGSAAWGDYDNDGDLDLVIAGSAGAENPSSYIYRNDGGTFTDIGADLTGVWQCSAAWGDYDNDGDLDLAVAGWSDTYDIVSKIYENENGFFSDIGAGLTGVLGASLAWGDCDADGDLDLALAGFADGGNLIGVVYRNDEVVFTDVDVGLPGVAHCSMAWGDYDADGDLDLAIAGEADQEGVFVSSIYRNDGGWTFTDIGAPLTGLKNGSLAWGDYDNDGDLDLVIAGAGMPAEGDQPVPMTVLYRNDLSTFSAVEDGLPDVGWSSVAWGDYDNDGDLDLAIAGLNEREELISSIIENGSAVANTKPGAPVGLYATEDGGEITFYWQPGSDAETPDKGLSYNLRVATTAGGDDVFSSMSDAVSGYRRIPATGNAQQQLSWTLKGLTEENYYWGVQAVDAGFMGSTWSTEQTHYGPWAKLYNSAGTPPSIQQASDGSFAVTGLILVSDSTGSDLTVLKLSQNGDIIWQKAYENSEIEYEYTFDLKHTSDGGDVILGVNLTTPFTSGSFWIQKLDADGNVEWRKTYAGDGSDFGVCIEQTSDGGYVVSGYTSSFGAGSSDVWVLKLDTWGNVTWQKTYGGESYDAVWGSSSCQQTSDGGYIVAGRTHSFGTDYSSDFWLLKLDPEGDILWQKTYGGDDDDNPMSVQQTMDGGYILAGHSSSAGIGSSDFWILRLDSGGNVIWQKAYGGANNDERCHCRQTSEGSFIASGFSGSFGMNDYDIWALKLDPDGNVIWQRAYGGSELDWVWHGGNIMETTDGGYIISGQSKSFDDYYSTLIMKIDSNGEIPDCSLVKTSNAVVVNTNVTGQDSNAIVGNSDVTITTDNVTVREGTVRMTPVCPGTP